jgi:sortase (surface protein transpeptidase)
MGVLDETEDATITLITCAAWNNELRTYMKRLIVTAEQTGVIPLETD